MLKCKLSTLFYTAEPIFGIAFELVQKLLANCYKQLSNEDANYLSSAVVGASVKCYHQCLRVIIMKIIFSKVIYKLLQTLLFKAASVILFF